MRQTLATCMLHGVVSRRAGCIGCATTGASAGLTALPVDRTAAHDGKLAQPRRGRHERAACRRCRPRVARVAAGAVEPGGAVRQRHDLAGQLEGYPGAEYSERPGEVPLRKDHAAAAGGVLREAPGKAGQDRCRVVGLAVPLAAVRLGRGCVGRGVAAARTGQRWTPIARRSVSNVSRMESVKGEIDRKVQNDSGGRAAQRDPATHRSCAPP